MKLPYKCFFLILLFIVLVSGNTEAECTEAFAGFTLYDMKGKIAKIPCSSHKVLLVNFWATWCAPCMAEIPQINELYIQFKGQGVEVVGISLDSIKPQKLDSFVKSLNLTYPVYLGKAQEMQSKLAIIAVPATLIIDSSGNIYRKLIGYHSKNEILAVITELLKITEKKKVDQ